MQGIENGDRAPFGAVCVAIVPPELGEQKKGGLDFLRVHKFKLSNQEVLLGSIYEEDEIILTLLKLGSHENFYRGIKNNL